MESKRRISSVLEDYLEAILKLERKNGAARVRDIAQILSVHKSTVTAALKALTEKGLVNYNPYESVTLTEDGREIAESVKDRHGTILRFLTDVLLVSREPAERNACRMEHVMDRNVLNRLDVLSDTLNAQPDLGQKLAKAFSDTVAASEAERFDFAQEAPAYNEPASDLDRVESVALEDLQDGDDGVVVELRGGEGLIQRLAAMGILPGRRLTVTNNRGSLIVRVNDNKLIIGRGMAHKIMVKRIGWK